MKDSELSAPHRLKKRKVTRRILGCNCLITMRWPGKKSNGDFGDPFITRFNGATYEEIGKFLRNRVHFGRPRVRKCKVLLQNGISTNEGGRATQSPFKAFSRLP